MRFALQLTIVTLIAVCTIPALNAGASPTWVRHAASTQRKATRVKAGARTFLVLPTTGKNASWDDVTRIYKTVTAARKATEKYQDIQVATRDGYRADPSAVGSWDRKGVYVQYTNSHLLSRPFNAATPPGLLYMKMGGAFMLSGVAYAMSATSSVAALDKVLPGSLANWQQRVSFCAARGKLALAAADKITSASECAAEGGTFTSHGRWIARAWIWLPGAGLFDAKPDPMAGMNMRAAKMGPSKTAIMTQGPYEMEMTSTSGKAPSWTDLQRVYKLFVGVKKLNDKFRDVAVAQAKGYLTTSVLYVPGQGAHYINPYLVFAPWNLKKPPVFVYDTVNGKEQLRSALYLMPETSTPKQLTKLFPPSMAAWHRHLNNCFTQEKVLPIHDEKTCNATSGAHWIASTPWMVHVWLWDKNAGLFDMDSDG